jgi:hypothetical protein
MIIEAELITRCGCRRVMVFQGWDPGDRIRLPLAPKIEFVMVQPENMAFPDTEYREFEFTRDLTEPNHGPFQKRVYEEVQ